MFQFVTLSKSLQAHDETVISQKSGKDSFFGARLSLRRLSPGFLLNIAN